MAAAVGAALVRAGIDQVFGVVGSGNFDVTNAMIAAGARYAAARHETGAATMADAYARMSTAGVAAVSLHQGCGLTNALTGITEAAKSRTPLVVVTAEATQPRSNFFVDQPALATAVGAVSLRVASAEEAPRLAADAVATAVQQRRTVLLNLPLDVQSLSAAQGIAPASVNRPLPPPAPASASRIRRRSAAGRRPAARRSAAAGRGSAAG